MNLSRRLVLIGAVILAQLILFQNCSRLSSLRTNIGGPGADGWFVSPVNAAGALDELGRPQRTENVGSFAVHFPFTIRAREVILTWAEEERQR